VLSKYFEKDRENVQFGENTFLPIYNVISKFGVIEHPAVYPRGYFIPMWTNAGTYLRDLHADFGYIGLFLGPYLLGLLASYFWIKFKSTGSLFYFVMLTYLYIIISFSVFYMITRAASWFVGFISLLIITPLLEKYLSNKNKTI
ncbi:MAG: oligosaccharide repeat unit polymerase, partial [Arcobacter sp.]|nr:oligosaccharide repeat unit polymerase [Arcobacter sp.]